MQNKWHVFVARLTFLYSSAFCFHSTKGKAKRRTFHATNQTEWDNFMISPTFVSVKFVWVTLNGQTRSTRPLQTDTTCKDRLGGKRRSTYETKSKDKLKICMVIRLFENCFVSYCFLLNLVHRRYKVMFDGDLNGHLFFRLMKRLDVWPWRRDLYCIPVNKGTSSRLEVK